MLLGATLRHMPHPENASLPVLRGRLQGRVYLLCAAEGRGPDVPPRLPDGVHYQQEAADILPGNRSFGSCAERDFLGGKGGTSEREGGPLAYHACFHNECS